MEQFELKYGCNPNQTPALLSRADGPLPFTVLNGRPGYINLLDALHSWQLVRELHAATGLPAAASFKHVSPAGAAIGLPLTETERALYFVRPDAALTPLACAYIRARGADRLSSYGDWAALSAPCDEATARYLKDEVSDGIIAPGYTPEALELLKTKKGGRYTILAMDPDYTPGPTEQRDVFGLTFTQARNSAPIAMPTQSDCVTQNKTLPQSAALDMVTAQIILKYTQSNSVCFVKNGQAIGIGAGQQSRIHCTRLAADKADRWWLRQQLQVLSLPFLPDLKRPARDNAIDVYLSSEYDDILRDSAWQTVFWQRPDPLDPEVRQAWIQKLSGVTCGSDAFFPFGDNVERARKSGASYIVQPGGSLRDEQVIETADRYGIVMAFTGRRLFHH